MVNFPFLVLKRARIESKIVASIPDWTAFVSGKRRGVGLSTKAHRELMAEMEMKMLGDWQKLFSNKIGLYS